MLHVLVLSAPGPGARSIVDAARDGERTVVELASSLNEYRTRSAQPHGEWVVVYDLNGFPAQPDEVFEHAAGAGVPVVVVASKFDSTDWIRLFKLGASDVLRSPVLAGELSRSIAVASRRLAAISQAGNLSVDRWYTRTLLWAKRLLSSR